MITDYSNYAVIFDMDGVIADTNPFHSLAWKTFAEKYNFKITEDDLKNHVYGRTNKSIFDYLFDENLSDDALIRMSDEKELLFRMLYKNKVQALPGLINLLKGLKANSFKAGLATSAPRENVDFILDELEIRNYFDGIVDSTSISKGKPDPEIYLKCANSLNTLPVNCLVFEDSLPGVEAANAAGMKVIGVTTTHNREELKNTTMVIDDFTGLDVKILLEMPG